MQSRTITRNHAQSRAITRYHAHVPRHTASGASGRYCTSYQDTWVTNHWPAAPTAYPDGVYPAECDMSLRRNGQIYLGHVSRARSTTCPPPTQKQSTWPQTIASSCAAGGRVKSCSLLKDLRTLGCC